MRRNALSILCLSLLAVASPAAPAAARPHLVSCIDGHLVTSLDQCPPIPEHKPPSTPVGHGGNGLLGGLLGGLV
jgi:hypothetical protein